MTSSALVSIVIPTCNRPEMLRPCLEAIRAAIERTDRKDIEVIVTDDSSGDETRRLVTGQYPGINWVQGPRRGPASNRNAGVRGSTGNWVFFIDDDCLANPMWVAALLTAIHRHPDCSVFEGKTVADRERVRLDEEAPVNTLGGYLWSCNMAIKRALFDRLGGFCESFPYAAMEDVDLRLRLQALGERFPFVADAVVCHPYRITKGLQFSIKQGRSYLHLVNRHPELVSKGGWWGWLMNAARRTKYLLLQASQCGFRGFPYGVTNVSIAVYFEFLARLRSRSSSVT